MRADRKSLALHFGKRLCACRSQAGISQEALGEIASLHRTEISLLERGEREPRLGTILKLAGVLEVPLHELVGGIEWTPARIVAGKFEFRNLRDAPVE